jgi:cysteinyl-tRNA synthetase
LQEAQSSLDRLYTSIKGCSVEFNGVTESSFSESFKKSMSDDFNVPGALAVLFEMARSVNLLKESGNLSEANVLASSMIQLSEPLGFLQQDPEGYLQSGVNLTEKEIDALIFEREQSRQGKNFKRSDQIRDQLEDMNIILEDSVEGTSWRRK